MKALRMVPTAWKGEKELHSEKPGPWWHCLSYTVKSHMNKELVWYHLVVVFMI